MDKEAKLEILMTLAADDREGPPGTQTMLPPRLRNAVKAAADLGAYNGNYEFSPGTFR